MAMDYQQFAQALAAAMAANRPPRHEKIAETALKGMGHQPKYKTKTNFRQFEVSYRVPMTMELESSQRTSKPHSLSTHLRRNRPYALQPSQGALFHGIRQSLMQMSQTQAQDLRTSSHGYAASSFPKARAAWPKFHSRITSRKLIRT